METKEKNQRLIDSKGPAFSKKKIRPSLSLLKKDAAGFTLIELLVVIAIIGLLASVVLVALNGARQKSRDAKRVADMSQMATALELFFSDKISYPTSATSCIIGAGTCLSNMMPNYLSKLPLAPVPADNPTGSSACTGSYGAGIGNDYQFWANAGPLASNYTLTFCISNPTGALTSSGIHTLTQAGFQ